MNPFQKTRDRHFATRRRAPFARLPALALVAAVIIAPACKGKPNVSLEIVLPRDVVDDTVWLEVAAYKDSTCDAVEPMLMNGTPGTSSARVAFPRVATDPNEQPPTFGDLDRGSYAFAAVARGDDCRVLATGCVEFEAGESNSVVIPMQATETPLGACGASGVCIGGRCVPPVDNKDPSVGALCSLELLGAGPLASAGGGTSISAPAIAVTPRGFVVVYREIVNSDAFITLLPIDPAGGALDATRRQLKGSCTSTDRSDGVGLLMNDTAGQVVLSACDGVPALELLSFKAKNADDESATVEITLDPTAISSPAPAAKAIALSSAHVAAQRAGAATGVLAFTQDGASRISTIIPGSGVSAPTGTFGGAAGMTGAWVAANEKVLALLAAGPLESPELGLVMVPATTPVDQFVLAENKPRRPISLPGKWGAVAALGSRVIVLSDEGDSAAYHTFDLERTTHESGSIAFKGKSGPTTGDLAIVNDRAYFGLLGPGSVSLHVFANATTTPLLLQQVRLDKDPRTGLAVAQVRDTGHVAVAATPTRVALAWTTASNLLSENEATGGYAVFACTP